MLGARDDRDWVYLKEAQATNKLVDGGRAAIERLSADGDAPGLHLINRDDFQLATTEFVAGLNQAGSAKVPGLSAVARKSG